MTARIALLLAVCVANAAAFPLAARAGVTVDLLFVKLNGNAITPTNFGRVPWGFPVELEMIIRMKNDEVVTGHAFSINYDLDGSGGLDVLHRGNWSGIAMNKRNTLYSPLPDAFSPTTPRFVGSWNSTNGGGLTTLGLLPAAGAFAGGYTIGTVVWKIRAGACCFADFHVGLFNPGVDGLTGAGLANISAVFHGATVYTDDTIIPEPGTAALIGLGLVGLVLAHRRAAGTRT